MLRTKPNVFFVKYNSVLPNYEIIFIISLPPTIIRNKYMPEEFSQPFIISCIILDWISLEL